MSLNSYAAQRMHKTSAVDDICQKSIRPSSRQRRTCSWLEEARHVTLQAAVKGLAAAVPQNLRPRWARWHPGSSRPAVLADCSAYRTHARPLSAREGAALGGCCRVGLPVVAARCASANRLSSAASARLACCTADVAQRQESQLKMQRRCCCEPTSLRAHAQARCSVR